MEGKKARKTDRRIEKTKQAMRHAFVELLKKKPYNAITISELTREADIDRRTFYLHYECIEDLVSEMQQLARNMIAEQLKNCENVQLDTLFDGLTNVVRDLYRAKLLCLFRGWCRCHQILYPRIQSGQYTFGSAKGVLYRIHSQWHHGTVRLLVPPEQPGIVLRCVYRNGKSIHDGKHLPDPPWMT